MTDKLTRILLVISFLLTLPAALFAEDYATSIEKWYEGRIARLTSDTGYLTIVARVPLEVGEYIVGSADDSDIRLPASGPRLAGKLVIQEGNRVSFYSNEQSGVRLGLNPITSLILLDDHHERGPTILTAGPISFYVKNHGGKLYLRIRDSESASRANFKGVERFPVDIKWRFQARFERYDPPRPITVPYEIGDVVQECPGVVIFEYEGKKYELEPLSVSSAGLEIMFGDETSGIETYGGGRFVYADLPDSEGNLYIDFNKAYSPPCAFNAFTTCPLPHKTNRLPFRVTAGEKKPE